MIIDCLQTNQLHNREYDVCIFGAGAIGIAMAIYLEEKTDFSIALVEKSSLEGNKPKSIEVENSGDISSALEGSRYRGLGGSTILWGGQALRFDSIDFGARPWLNQEGWILNEKDLVPYYELAEEILGVDGVSYDDMRPFKRLTRREREALSQKGLSLTFSRFTREPNFKERYLAKLNASNQICCYLNAKTEFSHSNADKLESVAIPLQSHKKHLIKSNRFVLAGGGIDTVTTLQNMGMPRLNTLPIGRFYNDHIGMYGAKLTPIDIKKFRNLFAPRVISGIKCVPKLCLEQRLQVDGKSSNINSNIETQVDDSDPLLLLRELYNEIQGQRRVKNIIGLAVSLIRSPISLFQAVSEYLFYGRVYLPRGANYFLISNVESVPVFESFVNGGQSTKEGPVQVNWTVTQHSKVALQNFYTRVKKYLEQNKIAQVELKPSLYANDDEWLKSCYGLYHHMGGTRMSSNPSNGVVDKDLKIHGIENLFIAGPSVLPTGSASNPTLTALALALRLCDHLSDR